jgi:hypothetical protein
MKNKFCAVRGFLYRGELIHQAALGSVVIFPSWMTPRRADGALVEGGRATFTTPEEAMLFVDAHFLMVERALFSYPQCTAVEA